MKKSTRSIVWDDGYGNVKWSYPENVSPPTKSKPIWLYNKYYNKCLYAQKFTNEEITYEECSNAKGNKWYVEDINGNTKFKSVAKETLCMTVDNKRIVTGNCENEKAAMKYIKVSKFIKNQSRCISGIDDRDDPKSQCYLTLSTCDRNNISV